MAAEREAAPGAAHAEAPLLALRELSLERRGLSVLDGVGFTLRRRETLGVVGESGAGKSTLALCLIGLLRPPEVTLAGSMRLAGAELVGLPERRWRGLRGRTIAMIFQDAGAALNPCFTVEQQLAGPLRRRNGLSRRAARERALALLASVGLNDAAGRLGAFPHELSGGMQQRVMIAIALAGDPQLLLADEPTSALDVTIQAQIMRLILDQTRQRQASCIFILHDLALASQVCDRIVVLYAGQVVEAGAAATILERPLHPYTQALKASVIELGTTELAPPRGSLPGLGAMPSGCRFAPRCPRASELCRTARPPLAPSAGRDLACWHPG